MAIDEPVIPDAPTIRLAHVHGAQGTHTLAPAEDSPTVRLAVMPAHPANIRALERSNNDPLEPGLLISYYYLDPWLKNQPKYRYRNWVMDSGAFSAYASGKVIDLQQFIERSKELLATDPTLTEVFSLDVIGDWRGTVRNLEKMWAAGVPAIPCYHAGDPPDLLQRLARDYDKIALGNCVGFRGKDEFAKQCFARIWPKKVHGFGFGGEKSIMALPWHSVDATNWEMGPCAFGRWNSYGKMSVRGSKQNLRVEVEWYLDLERKARTKWRKQMAQLNALPAPTVRLALGGNATTGEDPRREAALSPPTVRLAIANAPSERMGETFNPANTKGSNS